MYRISQPSGFLDGSFTKQEKCDLYGIAFFDHKCKGAGGIHPGHGSPREKRAFVPVYYGALKSKKCVQRPGKNSTGSQTARGFQGLFQLTLPRPL